LIDVKEVMVRRLCRCLVMLSFQSYVFAPDELWPGSKKKFGITSWAPVYTGVTTKI
jgi:hypothetical protein